VDQADDPILTSLALVFHCGMIVMASIQIYQTKIALEIGGDVSCATDYAVRP
jgi:hypothetical protein